MTSISSSAAIGLAVSIGPAIAAHLLPQIWILDQFGAVILGLIIGMQAASGRWTRHGRRWPDHAIADAARPAG